MLSTTPFVFQTQPKEFVSSKLNQGEFGWLHGIHGIGKTTLLNTCLAEEQVKDRKVCWLDLRREAYAYSNLSAAILHNMGMFYTGINRFDYRKLETVFNDAAYSHITVVLDELDVYDPKDVLPLQHVAAQRYGRGPSCMFISARSIEYFNRGNRASNYPRVAYQMRPLPRSIAYKFFEAANIPSRDAKYMLGISGGNPTVMQVLVRMYQATNTSDMFNSKNEMYVLEVFSYFRHIWESLEEDLKAAVLLGCILLINCKRNSPQWKLLRRSLDGPACEWMILRLRALLSFDERFTVSELHFESSYQKSRLPSVISPLFMTWVLIEHGRSLSTNSIVAYDGTNPITVGSRGCLGVPVNVWQDISVATTAAGNVVTLFKTLAGLWV